MLASRLEIGSGYRPTDGFMHLDANPACPDLDFVGAGYPIPHEVRQHVRKYGAFDGLRAVDVLEHVSYRHSAAVLNGWRSIMVSGGTLFVQVPDADEIMRWYIDDPGRLLRGIPRELPQTPMMGAQWRLLGGHADGTFVHDGDDWRWNAHYAMFSASSLCSLIQEAGFNILTIETNGHPNLLVTAVKQ